MDLDEIADRIDTILRNNSFDRVNVDVEHYETFDVVIIWRYDNVWFTCRVYDNESVCYADGIAEPAMLERLTELVRYVYEEMEREMSSTICSGPRDPEEVEEDPSAMDDDLVNALQSVRIQ